MDIEKLTKRIELCKSQFIGSPNSELEDIAERKRKLVSISEIRDNYREKHGLPLGN